MERVLEPEAPVEPTRRTRRWILVGGLGLLVVCCALTGWLIVSLLPGHHDFAAVRSLAAGDSTTLRINASSGTVSLRPSTDHRIHAQADGSYTSHRPDLVLHRSGRTMTLNADCPPANQRSCTVNVEVTLPPALGLRVIGSNSTIRADNLTGPLEMQSINGTIALTNPAGPLNLSSENGDIAVSGATSPTLVAHTLNASVQANFRAAPESTTVTCTNGGVDIMVPPSARYAINAQSHNGGTTIDPTLQNGRARRSISVRTNNGSITIHAA
jgi:hypothetical protein